MRAFENVYVNGKWVPSSGEGVLEVTNSATEEVIASVPNGSAADVDSAVAAAKAAFPGWSQLAREERAGYLMKIHAGLEARSDEIAQTIAQEVGMPLMLSNIIQAGLPKANFQIAAGLATGYEFEQQVCNSLVVREPIGVVGCITPWNYPLHQIALKVAPALAAGNTVVLKPSEVAPINAFILAEVIDEAGLPAGVFNLVTGVGPVVGEAIAAHADVDMVSFTGSTRAGKRVAEVASQTVKKVALELGGKSPNVILDDADFTKAVADGVGKCFLNSGQTCTALTRMLVPRTRLEEAEQIAAATAAAFTPGNPFEKTTRLGPLVSAAQRDRVRGFIQTGIDEGATLLAGGTEAPEGLEQGYFVRPTVFSNVTRDMTIAREEIFGPVLSIMPYDSEEEAVEIANDTIYG
ncbi:MAG: aldehyde dehydrogenase family protein, partial [Actinomycetes bacterium]